MVELNQSSWKPGTKGMLCWKVLTLWVRAGDFRAFLDKSWSLLVHGKATNRSFSSRLLRSLISLKAESRSRIREMMAIVLSLRFDVQPQRNVDRSRRRCVRTAPLRHFLLDSRKNAICVHLILRTFQRCIVVKSDRNRLQTNPGKTTWTLLPAVSWKNLRSTRRGCRATRKPRQF